MTIDTTRLDKLLGMLTSGYGGEQANAASMIARMAAERKMTVPELMEAAVLQKKPQTQQQQPQQQSEPPKHDFTDVGNIVLSKLRIITTECPQILNAWELEWATDVAGRYSSDEYLSPKQMAVANKILFKFETAQT